MNKMGSKHVEARIFSPLFKTAFMLVVVSCLMSFSFCKRIPNGTYDAAFEIKEGNEIGKTNIGKISVEINGDTAGEAAKMLEQKIQDIATDAKSQALKMFLPSKFEFKDNTMITFLGVGISDTCAIRYISNDKFLAGNDTVTYQLKGNGTISLTCKGINFTLRKTNKSK